MKDATIGEQSEYELCQSTCDPIYTGVQEQFIEKYKAGVHPMLIFKEYGYDVDVLGATRIKHFARRVQDEDLAATSIKALKPRKAYNAGKRNEEPLEKTILRMQNEIIYLQQEIAFYFNPPEKTIVITQRHAPAQGQKEEACFSRGADINL